MEIHIDQIAELASEVGLSLFASIPLIDADSDSVEESFSQFRDTETTRLQLWQESGYAADMGYMQRSPDLFLNPEHFLPGARSILSFAVSYHSSKRVPEVKQGFGRVARYAWGRDYHRVLKKRLRALAARLEQFSSNGDAFSWRVFTDAVPLLERALARYANQGFVGKNTMLIRPGLGSYFFIAEMITSALVIVPPEKQTPPTKGSCGNCNSCMPSCPTSAFVSSRVLNAERCISYLTIEKKTALSSEEQEWLGDWIFGCDICQEVCPFNHQAVPESEIPEFKAESGVGPQVDLARVLGLRDAAEYLAVFAGTPLMRAGRSGLLRNATCVAANQNCFSLVPDLSKLYREDSSEMLRSHAYQALQRMEKHADGLDKKRISAALAGGLR